MDRRPVERVDRLAQLQHHVVRGVNHVRDRALAGGEEAHLDVVRRRADGHAAHPPAHEPGTEVGVTDFDGQPVRDGGAAPLLHLDHRHADGLVRGGGHLPGQAEDRQGVAAVRLDVHVEDHVAVQVGQRHAQGRAGRQDEDPLAVPGEPQLLAGAQHAVGDDAHLLGPLDAAVAGQDGTRQRHRDALAGRDVGGAADDGQGLAPVPEGDGRQAEPVRAGVPLDRQELARDDAAPVRAPALDVP